MRIYGYGNILATMSLRNPRLTRNIFSQIMNNRVDSSSKKVKTALSNYDEQLSSAVKNSTKNAGDAKINEAVKQAKKTLDKEKFPQYLTNYLNSKPLYTGKSSIQTDYYSTIGSLYNYLL